MVRGWSRSAKLLYVATENRDLVCHDVPEDFIFKHIIAVSEHVSQANNLAGVCDLIGKGWMFSLQTSHRLSDDLQFSLDDKLQGTVVLEILESLTLTEDPDFINRSQNILAEFVRIMLHR